MTLQRLRTQCCLDLIGNNLLNGRGLASLECTLGIKELVLAQSNGTQELEPAARDELINDNYLHVRARDCPIEQ